MFTKIIDLLLQEKAGLDEQKALDIAEAVNAIETKYAERSEKIGAMLGLAGYVEPVVEEIDEIDEAEATEVVDEVVDEAVDETVDEGEATEAESGKTLHSI